MLDSNPSQYHLEVICSFDELDWKILRFFCDSSFNKELFLYKLFNRLNKDEITQLSKISICILCDHEVEVLPFINDCRGKLYFDLVHPDDIENNRIKHEYLSTFCINEI